ncbi:MAG: glycoside hydrolase family 3 protein [Acidimicrobiales bacterium]
MEPYEDPSLPVAERVEDLLGRMTLEEKAGQLFHNVVLPGPGGSVTEGPSGARRQPPATEFISNRLMTHFNLAGAMPARQHAEWTNRVQELAADTRLGIPVTLSSDPRHGFANLGAAFAARAMSQWPEAIGLAAIGDEHLVEEFGDTVRREYVAVGLRVALHPQADLATEPRWARIAGTFGEDAQLAARLTAAYIRGLRGGPELGPNSVASMVKHFPGGGPQLDGEDPHFAYGREQVYPGEHFDHHLIPFEAAFEAGVTQVMPYYGMPVGTQYEEVGFGFNHGVITGLLREKYRFDGIVCTDWALVTDHEIFGEPYPGRAWGVEHLTREERVQRIFDAGCDQLGGESCPEVVVSLVGAGRLAERRIDASVRRLLKEKFALGLFDDPFVDPHQAERFVGNDDLRDRGTAAQRSSCTLLKNGADGEPVLPIREGARIFCIGVDAEVAAEYGTVVERPGDAEVAIARVAAPFEERGVALERYFHAGSLDFSDQALKELFAIADAVPTVVEVRLERPIILTPVKDRAAALVGTYGISDAALLDVLFGRAAPEGNLPFELPSSMAEVEGQRSDVPFDTAHPLFEFGFGLRY